MIFQKITIFFWVFPVQPGTAQLLKAAPRQTATAALRHRGEERGAQLVEGLDWRAAAPGPGGPGPFGREKNMEFLGILHILPRFFLKNFLVTHDKP